MKPTGHLPSESSTAVLIAVEPGALAVVEARSPEWDQARAILAGVITATRQSVAGQVLLGAELEPIKKSLGFTPGGDRKGSKPQLAVLKSWDDWCRAELGISADTADRCIAAFKVIRHRAGEIPKDDAEEFRVLIAPPETLSPKDQEKLRKAIQQLLKGEDTQRSLLAEFRLLKPFKRVGGDTSGSKKPAEDPGDPALIASVPFRSLINDLDQVKTEISRLRFNEDLDGWLYLLPLASDDDRIMELLKLQPVLDALRGEIEADLLTISKRIAAMIEAKMQGDMPKPKRARKNQAKTHSKR